MLRGRHYQGTYNTKLYNKLIWRCMWRVRVMVFNSTFNNISVISWRSVVLVEEKGVLGENHWFVASHWQTLSHNVVSSTLYHERTTLVVICTDCTGSCGSNYHMIMTTTAPTISVNVFGTCYHFYLINIMEMKYIFESKINIVYLIVDFEYQNKTTSDRITHSD
jgi:hypothetical protein